MATTKRSVDARPDMSFTTARRRSKPITFEVDGEAYAFTPPKRASAFLKVVFAEDGTDSAVANTRAVFDWLDQGLPDDQSERLIARLKDPVDDFDVENLETIVEWLQEKVAGRPTT